MSSAFFFKGYLKSWAPAEMSEGGTNAADGSEESDPCNLSCLVAVGRALTDLAPQPTAPPVAVVGPATRHLQYVSRHATDGKFLFVDQRLELYHKNKIFQVLRILSSSILSLIWNFQSDVSTRVLATRVTRYEPLRVCEWPRSGYRGAHAQASATAQGRDAHAAVRFSPQGRHRDQDTDAFQAFQVRDVLAYYKTMVPISTVFLFSCPWNVRER